MRISRGKGSGGEHDSSCRPDATAAPCRSSFCSSFWVSFFLGSIFFFEYRRPAAAPLCRYSVLPPRRAMSPLCCLSAMLRVCASAQIYLSSSAFISPFFFLSLGRHFISLLSPLPSGPPPARISANCCTAICAAFGSAVHGLCSFCCAFPAR
jgi:hypothetical protein